MEGNASQICVLSSARVSSHSFARCPGQHRWPQEKTEQNTSTGQRLDVPNGVIPARLLPGLAQELTSDGYDLYAALTESIQRNSEFEVRT